MATGRGKVWAMELTAVLISVLFAPLMLVGLLALGRFEEFILPPPVDEPPPPTGGEVPEARRAAEIRTPAVRPGASRRRPAGAHRTGPLLPKVNRSEP
ncbi:hypothetical protein [Streptomyces sp. NPDC051569]|uniref:hypothetical protein n=1 Tax=Streptomyces sp. NPDC051569 TaxID=3365661 RepID=UPI0037A0D153